MITGEYTACSGGFFDSGGQGGGGYQNEEYSIVTICPENEGDVVGVDFTSVTLDTSGPENTWDYIAIFDGPDTDANGLGVYTGDGLTGSFVSASPLNPSGCLTFVFDSNHIGTGSFVGIITCETPCERPTVVATDDGPATRRICVGDEITFDGSSSFAAAGFNVVDYLWDFDNGETDNSGPIVTYSFPEPGAYTVELYVTDDNGCGSANLANLQFLVSTPPSWEEFPTDTQLCLGQEFSAVVDPDFYEITWTDAEDSFENPDDIFLEDVIGAPYESEIFINAFEPGQTLDDVNDLLDITVSMNHSWLFDLFVQITCPSGETTVLHNQWNLFDGTELGTNGTDLGVPDAEIFDYSWTNNPDFATWAEEAQTAGNNIPAGSYASVEPLDQLIGCELNGTWTLTIIDFWGGDDGDLDGWSIGFDPDMFPPPIEFTPDIGAQSDSSFWTLPFNGPPVLDQSADGNSFSILPDQEGSWDYTFSAINNHGCTYDSTITITVEQALQAEAGEDFTLCPGENFLNAGFQDQPEPVCSADAGSFEYCYVNNDNYVQTYCPDNLGDGFTFMSIVFTGGQVEGFFDSVIIYDGPDTNAPIIGDTDGEMAGQIFTATNPDGCITMQLTSDGSVDCQTSGFYTPLTWDVVCDLAEPGYVYEWAPAEYLDDPNIPNPQIGNIPGATTFTLTTYPVGRPECSSSDQVVATPGFTYEFSFDEPICEQIQGGITVDIDPDSGVAPWTVVLSEDGNFVDDVTYNGGPYTFGGITAGTYNMEISNIACTVNEEVILSPVDQLQAIATPADTVICYGGTATFNVDISGDPDGDVLWEWSTGETSTTLQVSPINDAIYSVFGIYAGACYTDTAEVVVEIYDQLSMTLTPGDTLCVGDSILVEASNFSGGLTPYSFEWTSDYGDVLPGESHIVYPEETGNWCCTMTDACETPENVQCINIGVYDYVDPTFEADTLGGCIPVTVGFTSNATNPEDISQSLWEFGDGGTSGLDQLTFNTYESQGTYTVAHTIVSEYGCISEHIEEDYLTFFNQPIAGFNVTPQTAVLPNSTMEFENFSLGSDVYMWVMNGLDSVYEEEPIYTFPAMPGTYPVTLYASNDWGCVDSISRTVFVVDEFVMYVPNAFTPDFDGVNDRWTFEGIDVDEDDFTLQIFNRWGEVVFTSTEFEEGWDGSYNRGGHFVPDGVYVWRIETRSLTTEERKELVGTVLIMR